MSASVKAIISPLASATPLILAKTTPCFFSVMSLTWGKYFFTRLAVLSVELLLTTITS